MSPSLLTQRLEVMGFALKSRHTRSMPKDFLHMHYLRDGRAPIPKRESISRVMSGNKGKNTKPELLLRRALWAEGVRDYRLHWKKAPGRPDLAFPMKRLAVFVNGCFWHRCPHCDLPMPKTNSTFWRTKFKKNKSRDKTKLQELKDAKWKTMVVWECEISKKMPRTVSRIKRFIGSNSLKQ